MQCESSITLPVTVYENPIVNAGDDITIPYGTSAQLNSTIEGGSGNYIISWQPSEKLVDNTIEDPITINLTETTIFTITVEDENSNCISSDEVTVIIDGDPMLLSITADENPICAGDPVVIEAVATEGSGELYLHMDFRPGRSQLHNACYYCSTKCNNYLLCGCK